MTRPLISMQSQPTAHQTKTMSLEIRTITTKPGVPPGSIVFTHNHPTLPKVEVIPSSAGSTYKVSYRYEVKMAHAPSQAGSAPLVAATKAPSSTASKPTRTSHEKHQPTPSRASDSASQSAKSGTPALSASPSPASVVKSDTKSKQRSVAPSVTTASRANGPTIVSRTKSEVTRAVSTGAPAATDISTSSCKNDSRSTITTGSNGLGVRHPQADDHDCVWCDCPKLPLPLGLVPVAPLDILPPGPTDEYECVRVTQRRVHIKSRAVQDVSGPQWVHQVASWTESASRDQNNNLHFIREGHRFEQIHRF
ncbi:hypothetical protein BJX65DRAFT_187856 [Aspergillus insuetus]